MVPLTWYIALSATIFVIGVIGFLVRRNILIMLISIELMLNSVNISLIAFSHYLQDLRGQVLVFFIITVAAAEAAIGLAILVSLFRNKAVIHTDEIVEMKG
ncbi:MAG TPA: NADH-quinone oxidoreductase subunit NuoK [Dissulfurispiraceae bacterium]|jgi:NADH:ubiquinone oxidoreductase subunit K|nr:NADH-quinone oxidoreductase subunit NuoK [Desulfomicrobium escambiense]HWR89872.1 NADH-quinone oxidoreductase subunit NuoK [Dissulfurispiraceae bacterium]